MIAFNHALTGAIIGLASGRPLIALPTAFVSHFICDAIPHYGNGASDEVLRSNRFKWQLIIDAMACVGLVIVLAIFQPDNWLLASFAAFLATSPDFAWMPGYFRARAGGSYRTSKRNRFMRFASWIQWFEKPIGAVVELAWCAAALVLLAAYL